MRKYYGKLLAVRSPRPHGAMMHQRHTPALLVRGAHSVVRSVVPQRRLPATQADAVPWWPRTPEEIDRIPIINIVNDLRDGPPDEADLRVAIVVLSIELAGGWYRLAHLLENRQCYKLTDATVKTFATYARICLCPASSSAK
jgi:hypothetical protein